MVSNFKSVQANFAAYIRDPKNNSVPANVKPERMAAYRELFFNNIESFISGNFPVLRKICNDAQWQKLTEGFFKDHSCQTPYFCEIAEEFLAYLQTCKQLDFNFMQELAHYEWVEMALAIADIELPEVSSSDGISLQDGIMLSPLAWSLVYQYPVQMISPDYLPEIAPAEATYLVVYRDQHDQVHFIQSNPLTYRLLQLIEEAPGNSAESYLQQLAVEAPHLGLDTLIKFGLQILQEFADKSIILPARAV